MIRRIRDNDYVGIHAENVFGRVFVAVTAGTHGRLCKIVSEHIHNLAVI